MKVRKPLSLPASIHTVTTIIPRAEAKLGFCELNLSTAPMCLLKFSSCPPSCVVAKSSIISRSFFTLQHRFKKLARTSEGGGQERCAKLLEAAPAAAATVVAPPCAPCSAYTPLTPTSGQVSTTLVVGSVQGMQHSVPVFNLRNTEAACAMAEQPRAQQRGTPLLAPVSQSCAQCGTLASVKAWDAARWLTRTAPVPPASLAAARSAAAQLPAQPPMPTTLMPLASPVSAMPATTATAVLGMGTASVDTCGAPHVGVMSHHTLMMPRPPPAHTPRQSIAFASTFLTAHAPQAASEAVPAAALMQPAVAEAGSQSSSAASLLQKWRMGDLRAYSSLPQGWGASMRCSAVPLALVAAGGLAELAVLVGWVRGQLQGQH